LWKNSAAVECSIYPNGFNIRLHIPQRKQKYSEYDIYIEVLTTIRGQRDISKGFSGKKQLIYYSLLFRNREFTWYFFFAYVTLENTLGWIGV